MNRSTLVRFVLGAALLAMLPMQPSSAYSLKSAKWASMDVPFYVNPSNMDLYPDALINAVNSGALSWTYQSHAPFRWSYAGTTGGTTVGNNGRNEVFFRNATNGGAVATTYTYYSGGQMLDADIVFWDAAYTFFTGTSGCWNGLYVEDVAAHEFGHALGLNHSADPSATMYASASYCSPDMRYLALDDIQGVEALYPPVGSNTLPQIWMSSPGHGVTYAEGAAIVLSGYAQDAEDGVLTSRITWSSNISGTIGWGGYASVTLPAGNHRITATVADTAGAVQSTHVDIAVASAVAPAPAPAPAPTNGPTLQATGTKIKGWKYGDLTWSGISTSSVVVYRDGKTITATANDGSHRDDIGAKGGGSNTYQVCAADNSACTNAATASF